MKSFKNILTEAQARACVVLFGRMNPPTRGHEENVMQAHALAQRHGADLQVIASHSHDAKKNPLSPAQKLSHLQRAFGHLDNTTIGTSSREAPGILHAASQAHEDGVQHFILAGGGDRAQAMEKMLKQYNGVRSAHGYYNFKKITVSNTGERQAGVSGTDMRRHAQNGNFEEFRRNLPSHIQSNEAHARELFHDVRSGMGLQDNKQESFELDQTVVDSFTGLQGRVVYLGPNYVTMMLEDQTAFKRWNEDVDAWTPPADLMKHYLDRLSYCPKAQQKFEPMLRDSNLDQSVVQEALDHTAHYLDVERYMAENPDRIDDHNVSEFVRSMQDARTMLHQLGVLDDHRAYMEQHAHTVIDLINKQANKEEAVDIGFKNYYREQAKLGPRVEDDLSDADIKAIEDHVDKLKWEDIAHLYANEEHGDVADAADITEAITAAERMKKRFEFLKSKAKRELAAKLALKRVSTQTRLKKRAVAHARSMIMQRLLRGRNKSQLSAAEKDRIESIVHRAKAAVVRISNRLMPKLRELELERLKRQGQQHEAQEYHASLDPRQHMTTYDAEEDASATVALHDTDTTDNPRLAQHRARIAGMPEPHEPVDLQKQQVKMKQFRKLEV